MTDPSAAASATKATVVPTVVERVLVSMGGQIGLAGAALLGGWGLIAPSAEQGGAALLGSIVVGAGNLLITYLVAQAHDRRLRTAVAAPAAVPVTK
jgi:hypothetical protein